MRIITEEQYELFLSVLIDQWYSKFGKYYKIDIDGSEYLDAEMMTSSECYECEELELLIGELQLVPVLVREGSETNE